MRRQRRVRHARHTLARHGQRRAPGQFNLRLRAIDRLGIEMFDFSGTGITPAHDADPLDYEVATGASDARRARAGRGGQGARLREAVRQPRRRTSRAAPSSTAAICFPRSGIGWGLSGTTAPFLSMDAAGLVLDLGNPSIGSRHIF